MIISQFKLQPLNVNLSSQRISKIANNEASHLNKLPEDYYLTTFNNRQDNRSHSHKNMSPYSILQRNSQQRLQNSSVRLPVLDLSIQSIQTDRIQSQIQFNKSPRNTSLKSLRNSSLIRPLNKQLVSVRKLEQQQVEIEYFTESPVSQKKINAQRQVETRNQNKLNSTQMKKSLQRQVQIEYNFRNDQDSKKIEDSQQKVYTQQKVDPQNEILIKLPLDQALLKNPKKKNSLLKKKQKPKRHPTIPKDLQIDENLKVDEMTLKEQLQFIAKEEMKKVNLNDVMELSSESATPKSQNFSEDFQIWDDSELAMRGINVNQEYFTVQQQQQNYFYKTRMAKLYQIRSGTYPEQRELVTKEEIAANLKQLLCQKNDKLLQRIDQAVRMIDNSADYSRFEDCTQNNMNFFAFKHFAKNIRVSKTNNQENDCISNEQ